MKVPVVVALGEFGTILFETQTFEAKVLKPKVLLMDRYVDGQYNKSGVNIFFYVLCFLESCRNSTIEFSFLLQMYDAIT